jgi:hypothetical protein
MFLKYNVDMYKNVLCFLPTRNYSFDNVQNLNLRPRFVKFWSKICFDGVIVVGHVGSLKTYEFIMAWRYRKSQDSSISTVTRLRAGRPGFDSRQEQKFFSRPDRLPGPPSLLSDGYRVLFPRGKAAEE